MATLTTPITIDEFEQLPDDVVRYKELVDGELVDVSGNIGDHISLRDGFMSLLHPFVRRNQIGRVLSEQEFQFGKDAHGPDISFFGAPKVQLYNGRLRVQRFVPDLAIEISSQSDAFDNLIAKVLKYRSCGTKEAWAISIPSRLALAFCERGDVIVHENQNFESPLISGFSVRLADLFAMI